jgi:hypothetical protein
MDRKRGVPVLYLVKLKESCPVMVDASDPEHAIVRLSEEGIEDEAVEIREVQRHTLLLEVADTVELLGDDEGEPVLYALGPFGDWLIGECGDDGPDDDEGATVLAEVP